MIVLLNSSTSTFELVLVDGEQHVEKSWESGRELAKNLLGFVEESLIEKNVSWDSIEGLGVYKGPGSFTGLRIGLTVANTLAESLGVPIVGVSGEQWQDEALTRLRSGDNDRVVMPEYGSEAHITSPRK
jgi:tRNA threonylcarbamoyladenosine biosynthesis protein TsaB